MTKWCEVCNCNCNLFKHYFNGNNGYGFYLIQCLKKRMMSDKNVNVVIKNIEFFT